MATITKAPAPRRRPGTTRQLLGGYLARLVLAAFFAFPIVFMFVSSLKPDDQIFADLGSIKAFLPVGDLSLDNYGSVFDTVPAWRFLANSIAISAATVALGLFVNSLAAFAISRMRWRGQGLVLAVIIATLVVPFETFALPMVWWVNKLPWLTVRGGVPLWDFGWLDTYRVQVIPFVANAFSIYLFYTFFAGLPKQLDEAARVDGASAWQTYRRIIVPMSKPVFASVAILTFLSSWGSFLWPVLMVDKPAVRPLPLEISVFQGQPPFDWGQIFAFGVMMVLPVLIVFLAFQRWFVQSVASSGLKG